MAYKLKPSISSQIISDWALFIEAGRLTGLKPMSLYTALRHNSKTVCQYHVLQGIAKKLKADVDSIIESVSDDD